MKRILVVDESEMVRETLALILGRSFVVVKRPFGQGALSFDNAEQSVDLLILGIAPAFASEASKLFAFAMHAPCAVLFLVDSKSAARGIEDSEHIGCLTKPFNPYELKEKVTQLLTRRPALRDVFSPSNERSAETFARYLEFPYLTRSASTLVRRFAASPLPVLICGEIGCGQDRVARGMCALQETPGFVLTLDGAEVGADYLARKRIEVSVDPQARQAGVTVLIENIDQMERTGQSPLLEFLAKGRESFPRWRVITTTNADLLERLYRGELVEGLYRDLAMLALKLPPLRERPDDLRLLAEWLGRRYARELGLAEPVFSNGAVERLKTYLWFGNLGELETVIARTLAIRKKSRVDASDLIFDFMDEDLALQESATDYTAAAETKTELQLVSPSPVRGNGLSPERHSANGHAKALELNTVIHELAHELKNPMVTIKTFAQLLQDRYQDEDFRARFQDVVGHDIDRMDELLEAMVEFADFPEPRAGAVSLEQKLRFTLNEISPVCAKRGAQFRWKGDGYSREIRIDESHLKFVLKNVLLTVVTQAKRGTEIEIDVEKDGRLNVSFSRELARVASITPYLTLLRSLDESVLPLRILLAKHLVEKNGGRMTIDQSDDEKDVLRMEFPIA